MNVIFDNIIFSLQRNGGISVVWNELLKRALQDERFGKTILDYKSDNIYRGQLHIPHKQLVEPAWKWMERYRQPSYPAPQHSLFHSSYFRILRQPTIKNITTVHDLTYHYYRSGLAKRVHLTQEQQAVTASEGIICISESTRRDLLNFYPHLREDRIKVINNGVSEVYRRVEVDSVTPFEKGSFLIYVGNREAAYKNYSVAIQVASLTHMPLVVVGAELDNSEREQLNTLLGEGQFFELANQTQEQLNILYNQAFALIYPSAYEGFGLPIVEAQRSGCLVMAQDVSSLPEVMGDGGILVSPNDDQPLLAQAFAEVISDVRSGRINRDEIVQKGERNAQRYSWDKTYDETYDFYRFIDQEPSIIRY